VAPPVQPDLLGLVDGRDQQAHPQAEDLGAVDHQPHVPDQHDARVQHPLEHVGQVGVGLLGRDLEGGEHGAA
jgi:hypothetical protein